MPRIKEDNDSVRSSRAGHTFHERWAARRALQLVFPEDDLFAIAVEGISTTETARPGAEAEEVADLVMYYGNGDNFTSCTRLETAQFKYKLSETEVTASYLKKTIEKFCDTIRGYDREFSASDVDAKLGFVFVTNAEFSTELWAAIEALRTGVAATNRSAATQSRYLSGLCVRHDLADPSRLFTSRVSSR